MPISAQPAPMSKTDPITYANYLSKTYPMLLQSISLQQPHTLTALVRKKREVLKSSEEHRHQTTDYTTECQACRIAEPSMDPSIHRGVHIYAPDLATRSTRVDPWASTQTYHAKAHIRNTKLSALVCSIYPRSALHCSQRKLVCCSPDLLGGFGISPAASTPRSAWKHHHAVLHSCIFLGKVIKRVLHKTSTCKLSYEVESSYKKSLAALIQEGWWALWGGDYSAQDLNELFSTLQTICFSKGLF